MEIIDYARMLARRWRWVVALTLLGVIGGLSWAIAAPKTYQADAELFVGSVVLGDNDATSAAAQSASQFTLGRMQSYAALVGSPGVTRGRSEAERLGLTDEEFADRVYATVPPQTVILRVFGFDGDPRRAADIANVAAERLSDVIEDLEASANGGRAPVDVTVTRAAVPPSVPVSPNRRTALGLGLVLGIGAGLLAAALRDQNARGGERSATTGPRTAPPLTASAADDGASGEPTAWLRAARWAAWEQGGRADGDRAGAGRAALANEPVRSAEGEDAQRRAVTPVPSVDEHAAPEPALASDAVTPLGRPTALPGVVGHPAESARDGDADESRQASLATAAGDDGRST